MKSLSSETEVRQWHIKVDASQYNSRKPQYTDFCIAQVWIPRVGEMLYGYRANKSGRPTDLMDYLFERPGEDWLLGLEYLLRCLEGESVDKLRLDKKNAGDQVA